MPIINQVVKGGGTTKYGIAMDALVGNAVNGVLQAPGQTSIVMSGFSDIASDALSTRFYGVNLTSFSAPGLTRISGAFAMSSAFQSATVTTLSFDDVVELSGSSAMQYVCRYARITTFSMASLRVISGEVALANAFSQVSAGGPTTVSLPSLEEITGRQVFLGAFAYCSNLTIFELPSLSVLSGQLVFSSAFRGSGITTLTLGGTAALDFGTNTDQFNNMFTGCAQNITVNAPAGNQTEIEAMSGYPNFGGTGTVTWNWVS